MYSRHVVKLCMVIWKRQLVLVCDPSWIFDVTFSHSKPCGVPCYSPTFSMKKLFPPFGPHVLVVGALPSEFPPQSPAPTCILQRTLSSKPYFQDKKQQVFQKMGHYLVNLFKNRTLPSKLGLLGNGIILIIQLLGGDCIQTQPNFRFCHIYLKDYVISSRFACDLARIAVISLSNLKIFYDII